MKSKNSEMATEEPQENLGENVVLVMGLTGAGKTTFVNHITGSKFDVGSNMNACTTTARYAMASIDGVEVAFVDTPGFEDPDKSDSEVLIDISDWIGRNLGGDKKVLAALYFHSIAIEKMFGSALRNYNLFTKIVGSGSMKNVGLVTTRWDTVAHEVAEDREAQLLAKPWNMMSVAGSRPYRLYNDFASCRDMVVDLLSAQPDFIKLQKEMAFENKPLSRTEAGEHVYAELKQRIESERASITESEAQIKSDVVPEALKSQIEKQIQESKLRLGNFEKALERIEKIPTWDERGWQFTKQHWSTIATTAWSVYSHQQNSLALQTTQETAAAALSKVAELQAGAAAAAATAGSSSSNGWMDFAGGVAAQLVINYFRG